MRSIQQIFNAIIAAGLYSAKTGQVFMCNSLTLAHEHQHIITREECGAARHAIKEYLQGHYTLYRALAYNGVSSSFESTLSVYQDWDNRPPITIGFEEEEEDQE